MTLTNVDAAARWAEAHAGCLHGRTKAESLDCWKRRRPALDEGNADSRQRIAAKVADAFATFSREWFTWEDWVDAGCYSGQRTSGHRMWRFFLRELNYYEIPHEVIEWETRDGKKCNALRFSTRTRIWADLEAGLVCANCGDLFRPEPSQIGLASENNPVRCEVCA